MPAAVLYLRVSTEEQVSNLSLDTQEAETRALCERNGWEVAQVFREEGASAKTLERPAIQRLLAYVGRQKARIGYLVVLRVDRLSRNRDDFYLLRHALRRHGVKLVSVREEIADDSISAMIVETFSVLQAQVDNMIRSSRTRTGQTEALKRGRWVWQAPIGYRHAPHVDGRPVGLELDPEQAPLVARAFERVASGTSVDAAHRELVAAGMRTAAGRPIGRQTFHALFRRPLYCGRIEAHGYGIETASAAPAIVSEDLYARAQREIATRHRHRCQTASLADFPLRGVARCRCGRRLAAYHARGKTGRRWPYYRCQRCRLQVPLAQLEREFEAMLARLAAPEAAVAYLDRQISAIYDQRAAEMERRLSSARRRLTTAEQRLETLLALRLDGELEPEEYARTRARVAAERDAARAELSDLTAPLDRRSGLSPWQRQLLTHPTEVWSSLDGNRRAALADLAFPDGLTFDGREFSNPAKSLMLLPLQPDSSDVSGLVRAAGRESNSDDGPLARVLAWRISLSALEQRVRRAA